MILTVGPIYYRDRTLLADLASRSGSPQDDIHALSPYAGQYDEACRQAPDDVGVHFILEQLNKVDVCPDYSATKAGTKPAVPYYKGAHLEKGCEMKLENTHETWLYQYLKSQIISIKIHNRGGVIQLRRQVQEDRPFYDEEGNITYQSTLLTDRDENGSSNTDIDCANLRYCLKYLHRASRKYKVSLLSLLISLAKYPGRLNVDQLLSSYPVWGVDEKTGDFTNTLPKSANHNALFPKALAAVTTPGTREYDVAQLLKQTCVSLGIQLGDEDPTIFTTEFIDKLVVTTISNNRDYVSKRNVNVLSALSASTIEDVAHSDPVVQQQQRAAQTTCWLLYQSNHPALSQRGDLAEIDAFLAAYNQVLHDPQFTASSEEVVRATKGRRQVAPGFRFPGNREFLKIIHGFYALPGASEPYQFQVGGITSIAAGGDRAMLHVSGILVLVRSAPPIYTIPVTTATDYLHNIGKPMGEQLFGSDTKMGVWDRCYA